MSANPRKSAKERFSRRAGRKIISVRWRDRGSCLLPPLGWFYAEKDSKAVLKGDFGRWPDKVCGFFINTRIASVFIQVRRFSKW